VAAGNGEERVSMGSSRKTGRRYGAGPLLTRGADVWALSFVLALADNLASGEVDPSRFPRRWDPMLWRFSWRTGRRRSISGQKIANVLGPVSDEARPAQTGARRITQRVCSERPDGLQGLQPTTGPETPPSENV
jgi:hypothetical protein